MIKLAVTMRDIQRYKVLAEVIDKNLSLKDAARGTGFKLSAGDTTETGLSGAWIGRDIEKKPGISTKQENN